MLIGACQVLSEWR